MPDKNTGNLPACVTVIKHQDDLPAQHDEDACGLCQYVANRDSILVTKEQELKVVGLGNLRQREKRIISLGLFTLPRWPGCSVWYLFQCPDCDSLSRDYTHRYRPYLRCVTCGFWWRLKDKRFYLDSGLRKPLSWLEELCALWSIRRRLYLVSS